MRESPQAWKQPIWITHQVQGKTRKGSQNSVLWPAQIVGESYPGDVVNPWIPLREL